MRISENQLRVCDPESLLSWRFVEMLVSTELTMRWRRRRAELFSLSTCALPLRPSWDSRGGCLYVSTLEVFYERIRDFRPMVIGDARGRALHAFHQAIEVVA
jgi:hypothetical protein